MVEKRRWLVVAADTAQALTRVGMSVTRACEVLGLPRSTFYEKTGPDSRGGVQVPHRDRAYPNRMHSQERAAVVERLNQPDTQDLSIRQAFYTLLDNGEYHCSLASMHRIMRDAGQAGDRRRRRHEPGYYTRQIPRLRATGPRQVWCWDITTVMGPGRQRFKLFSMIDLYSRKVVAHRVEHGEVKELGGEFVEQAIAQERCRPLVIHADNGSAMRSGTMHDLLHTLHITASHSRPRVSNDNAYAEALFKTVKYDQLYPERFDSIAHARAWADDFFDRYNTAHHHSGLAGHTPDRVHDGSWPTQHHIWHNTKTAYAAKHPERHRRCPPVTPEPPDIVWINKPKNDQDLSKTG